jgi:hypothetical protein
MEASSEAGSKRNAEAKKDMTTHGRRRTEYERIPEDQRCKMQTTEGLGIQKELNV